MPREQSVYVCKIICIWHIYSHSWESINLNLRERPNIHRAKTEVNLGSTKTLFKRPFQSLVIYYQALLPGIHDADPSFCLPRYHLHRWQGRQLVSRHWWVMVLVPGVLLSHWLPHLCYIMTLYQSRQTSAGGGGGKICLAVAAVPAEKPNVSPGCCPLVEARVMLLTHCAVKRSSAGEHRF